VATRNGNIHPKSELQPRGRNEDGKIMTVSDKSRVAASDCQSEEKDNNVRWID
jgi:hypothetical protein